jgi:hypothetical protein
MSYLQTHENNNLGHNDLGHSDIGHSDAGGHKDGPYAEKGDYKQTVVQQHTTILNMPNFRYDYGLPNYPNYDRTYVYDHPSPYKIHDDNISKFFIGSVTVVGLFILYRILEKNK